MSFGQSLGIWILLWIITAIIINVIMWKKRKSQEPIRDPFDPFPMITQIICERCGDPPFIRKFQRFDYIGQEIPCPKCKYWKAQIEGIYTLTPFSKMDEKTRELYEKWQ